MTTSGRGVAEDETASTLFVSDLDFTLLRSDATLSPYSSEVINGLVGEGVLFTYATARSPASARRATRSLELELPAITYGGTMTVHPSTGIPYAVRSLPAEALREILRTTSEHSHLQPLVHTYRDGRDSISWLADAVTDGVDYFLQGRPDDPRLSLVSSWDEIDPTTVYYVSIIGAGADVAQLHARLVDVLRGCMLIFGQDPYAPAFSWLEIHSDDGSKAHAAQILAEQIGATRLVVFGDNHNDIPLFEIADESYAVANAVPELRRIASGVLLDNDADAVAAWLSMRFWDV